MTLSFNITPSGHPLDGDRRRYKPFKEEEEEARKVYCVYAMRIFEPFGDPHVHSRKRN